MMLLDSIQSYTLQICKQILFGAKQFLQKQNEDQSPTMAQASYQWNIQTIFQKPDVKTAKVFSIFTKESPRAPHHAWWEVYSECTLLNPIVGVCSH